MNHTIRSNITSKAQTIVQFLLTKQFQAQSNRRSYWVAPIIQRVDSGWISNTMRGLRFLTAPVFCIDNRQRTLRISSTLHFKLNLLHQDIFWKAIPLYARQILSKGTSTNQASGGSQT